jgi:hypothetical protein
VSFGTELDPTAFQLIPPEVDLNAKNTPESYGSRASANMDFDDYDRAPMHALNEIIWKSVRGANSRMPPPVHRYRPIVEAQ